jgi:G3E family GTPase
MHEPDFKPVPMTILSGFLGAGKTTVLNHILHGNHGLKIAVLVNDFGAINIDAQLVVGVEGEMVQLSNGCICCTIRGDLLKETLKLLERAEPPEYILIETSGVSDPIAVANTFLIPELYPLIRLDSILVVVDADQLFSLDRTNTELALDQIGIADIVILNKVDLVTPAELQLIKDHLGAIIPNVRILETTYGQVPLELVLGMGQYDPERVHHREERDIHVHGADEEAGHEHEHHVHGEHDAAHDHHHHEHTDHTLIFSTWSWETDMPLALLPLRDALDQLPNTIYRAKGVMHLKEAPENRVIFQLVGKRASLIVGEAWQTSEHPHTQIVVISSHGGIDPDLLREKFEGCIALQKSHAKQMTNSTAWTRKG